MINQVNEFDGTDGEEQDRLFAPDVTTQQMINQVNEFDGTDGEEQDRLFAPDVTTQQMISQVNEFDGTEGEEQPAESLLDVSVTEESESLQGPDDSRTTSFEETVSDTTEEATESTDEVATPESLDDFESQTSETESETADLVDTDQPETETPSEFATSSDESPIEVPTVSFNELEESEEHQTSGEDQATTEPTFDDSPTMSFGESEDTEANNETTESASDAESTTEPQANDSDFRDEMTRTMPFDAMRSSIKEDSEDFDDFEDFESDELPPLPVNTTEQQPTEAPTAVDTADVVSDAANDAASDEAQEPEAKQLSENNETIPFAEMKEEVSRDRFNLPDGKLISALPMDDVEFREIVEEFKERAQQQVTELETALQAEDWHKLATTAHWLKGSGGTAGFSILTDVGVELEQAAHRGDADDCRGLIAQTSDLIDRISFGNEEDEQPTEPSSPVNESTNTDALADEPADETVIADSVTADSSKPEEQADETATADSQPEEATAEPAEPAAEAANTDNSFGVADSTQRPSMLASSSENSTPDFRPEDDELSEWTADSSRVKKEEPAPVAPTAAPELDATDMPTRISSTLPMDDEDFVEIVQEFIERFQDRLVLISNLAEKGEFADLAVEAHWLKGSGGSAGFPRLTEIAAELEGQAKENNFTGVEATMKELQSVAERLYVPEAAEVL